MLNGLRVRPVFASYRTAPFVAAPSLSRMIDQLFEDASGAASAPQAAGFALDISESDEALIVRAALPGFTPEQVSADIKEGVLTIAAERAEAAGDERYHRRERRAGRFSRQFALPFPVQEDKVTASLVNGELTLTLPKVPKPVATKIAIGNAPVVTSAAPTAVAGKTPMTGAVESPAPKTKFGPCGNDSCGCSN